MFTKPGATTKNKLGILQQNVLAESEAALSEEPQEGMDTELAQKRLATLTPLFVFRYSATHKRIINRLYRLTPYDAYAEELVKKIEVLSVAEINDEALLKIELQEIQAQAGQDPKARLNLWHNIKTGFTLKPSKWLKVGDNLGAITNNISYQDFTVERIYKSLRDKNWKIHFSNGVKIEQNQRQGDISDIFRQQLYWLISSHLLKLTEHNLPASVAGTATVERRRRDLCFDRR